MRSSSRPRRWLRAFGLSLASLGLSAPPLWAQHPLPRHCPTPPSPYAPHILPAPSTPAAPSETPAPAPTTPTTPTEAPEAAPETSGLGATDLGGAAGETGLFAAPNMQGHLLRSTRSIGYFYNRVQNGVFVNDIGTTSISNAAIADNASPVPRDRVAFRWNHFANAQSVTGLADSDPVIDDSLGKGVRRQDLQTREFDVNLYTFQFEKTFLDGLASVEFRLPFSTGLASEQHLSVGTIQNIARTQQRLPDGRMRFGYFDPRTNASQSRIVGPGAFPTLGAADADAAAQGLQPLQAYTVNRTSPQTRGESATELGNLSLIFKGILYQNDTCLVSGGLGVGIPTGDDTRVTVTDFVGGPNNIWAELQRVRAFEIDNDTWTLSPFVAGLWTPTDRFFAQGFLQFELPLNGNGFTYRDTFPNRAQRIPPNVDLRDVFASGTIDEQSLMHVDIGAGFWVIRDPRRRWLTGLAPTVELHYTTALEDADTILLPSDGSRIVRGGNVSEVAPGSRIGSERNRVDILDLNLGVTALLAERATLATSVVLPLKGADNRTFEWEVMVQLNVFFGGSRPQGPRFAPNF